GDNGETVLGLQTAEEALARCKTRDEGWYLPELLRIKGELSIRQAGGTTTAAEDCFAEAAALARGQGALAWGLRRALSLARMRIEQDRRAEARQVLAPVYARFTEGFATADLRFAATVLAQL